MTILLMVVYFAIVLSIGLFLGSRTWNKHRKNQLGWGGVVLLLLLGFALLVSANAGNEVQTYFWGALLIFALPNLLILAMGFALGQRIARSRSE